MLCCVQLLYISALECGLQKLDNFLKYVVSLLVPFIIVTLCCVGTVSSEVTCSIGPVNVNSEICWSENFCVVTDLIPCPHF